MFTKLTKELDRYVVEMGVPFLDCIVMKEGKEVYRYWNGYTDIMKTQKVTGKELYYIYSCSKLITCVAALQLWEKGMFKLDDKLSDYLPEFKEMTVKKGDEIAPAQNPILIWHLFTMTAGYSYRLDPPQIVKCWKETNGECPTRELIRYLAKEPLIFEPGERWEYSLCHDILAALVEELSGVTFGEYVKKNIFDPLNMENSTFLVDNKDLDKIVTQFEFAEGKGVYEVEKLIPFKFGSKYESGGAGCISTVEDYIKFLEALRVGDVILKKETIDLLATHQLTEEQMKTYDVPDYGYGLGQKCPKDDKMSDFGWGGAAGSYYAIDRKNDITVFLATHILALQTYQRTREQILPIIQEILK